MRGRWLETMTWPDAKQRLDENAVVIVPVGAIAKEHGPHLPLNTDYLTARALAEGVADALPVLIAPIVAFGYYPAFTRYPASQHLRAETFIAVLVDILGKLITDGAKRIAVINTGVSTEAPLEIALRTLLETTGVRIAAAHIRSLAAAAKQGGAQKLGGHADAYETALMLAIAPELVHMDRAAPDFGHMLEKPRTVFSRPVRFNPNPASGIDYSATGARGDPTLADAELGRRLLAEMIGELVDGIRALYPDG